LSHTVHSKPNLQDVKFVCKAFEALGWKVVPATTCRSWAAADAIKKYAFVAKNPQIGSNGYDVGLVPEKGGVRFEHESMLPVDSIFGKGFSLLKQEYAKLKIIDQVESNHGTYGLEKLANGIIQIEVEMDVLV